MVTAKQMRSSIVTLCVCIIGLFGSACDEVSADESFGTEPDKTFVDEHGRLWVRSHKIEYLPRKQYFDSLALPLREEDDIEVENQQIDPYQMTDIEYGEHLKPIADIGGWEYHLSHHSLEDYGAWMRQRAIARLEADDGDSFLFEAPDSAYGTNEEPILSDESAAHTRNAREIDEDGRVVFNLFVGQHPFRIIGAIHGAEIRCTAFKAVNHYSAATAAHCLHTGSRWLERSPIQFTAGATYNPFVTLPPAVPAHCYAMTINSNYTSHPNLPKNDYAVIALRGRGGASCPSDSWNYGYFGWKSVSRNENFTSYVSGYPGTEPWPTTTWPGYPSITFSQKTNGVSKTVFRPNVVRFTHFLVGGQSGSPFFSHSENSGYQARAITYGRVSVNRNGGREFNAEIADFIIANGGY